MHTVHRLEYAVAAALYRQVYVFADVVMLRHSIDNLKSHILRVRGREANAHLGVSGGYHIE